MAAFMRSMTGTVIASRKEAAESEVAKSSRPHGRILATNSNETDVTAASSVSSRSARAVLAKAGSRLKSGLSSKNVTKDSKKKKKKKKSSRKDKRRRPRAQSLVADAATSHIFCSDLYTPQFVKDALQEVEDNKMICNLVLEDLIQRNDLDTTKAVVSLLVNNTLQKTRGGRSSMSFGGRSSISFGGRGSISFAPLGRSSAGGASSGNKRAWQDITIIDCISDATTYLEYAALKSRFQESVERQLAMKGLRQDLLPIKFEAKIELHSLLDAMGVIALLQAIERDDAIAEVRFDKVAKKTTSIPQVLARLVDADTLQWTDTTHIYIRYWTSKARTQGGGSGLANPATALVKECREALQRVAFGDNGDEIFLSSTMMDLSSSENDDDDDDEGDDEDNDDYKEEEVPVKFGEDREGEEGKKKEPSLSLPDLKRMTNQDTISSASEATNDTEVVDEQGEEERHITLSSVKVEDEEDADEHVPKLAMLCRCEFREEKRRLQKRPAKKGKGGSRQRQQ